MKEVQDIIGQQLAKAIAGKVDVEKLAAKIAPRIEKQIVDQCVKHSADGYWWELIYEELDLKPIAKQVSRKISEAFEKQ